MTTLTPVVLDRAVGAMLGSAAGDALGAGYEFGTPPAAGDVDMIGGGLGNFEPGEWTDDTAQAQPILTAAAAGTTLASPAGLQAIAAGWMDWWLDGPADIGVHTREVFSKTEQAKNLNIAATMHSIAATIHQRSGHTAGNGALMRTAPVALAYLDDRAGCAQAARRIATLSHADPLAGDACVLWSEAIRVAITEGHFDGLRAALDLIEPSTAGFWARALDAAEQQDPSQFRDGNGFTVTALQAAWSAITHTATDNPASLAAALRAAVAIGHDTDTIAAIAGGLLGARFGATAIPWRWRSLLHGWPGRAAGDLTALAVLAVRGGRTDSVGWPTVTSLVGTYRDQGYRAEPTPVAHPDDDGLLLGTSATLPLLHAGGPLAGQVDVVVSLCRVGTGDVPSGLLALPVWLIDSYDAADNPNLDVIATDTVDALIALRGQGKRVLLHCVAAESRTPTIAALYAARVAGGSGLDGLARVRTVLPAAAPKPPFLDLLTRLS